MIYFLYFRNKYLWDHGLVCGGVPLAGLGCGVARMQGVIEWGWSDLYSGVFDILQPKTYNFCPSTRPCEATSLVEGVCVFSATSL